MATKKKPSDEMIRAFELKYVEYLLEWLNLVNLYKTHFAWKPDRRSDLYGVEAYEISCKHSANLERFERTADKNILGTYLKYCDDNRAKITYPYTWNYSEPEIDLVLNPQD